MDIKYGQIIKEHESLAISAGPFEAADFLVKKYPELEMYYPILCKYMSNVRRNNDISITIEQGINLDLAITGDSNVEGGLRSASTKVH